jgi:hypothetical protein
MITNAEAGRLHDAAKKRLHNAICKDGFWLQDVLEEVLKMMSTDMVADIYNTCRDELSDRKRQRSSGGQDE